MRMAASSHHSIGIYRSSSQSASVRVIWAFPYLAASTISATTMAVFASAYNVGLGDSARCIIMTAAAMTMLVMLMGATTASVDSVPCPSGGAGSTMTVILAMVMILVFAIDNSGSCPGSVP